MSMSLPIPPQVRGVLNKEEVAMAKSTEWVTAACREVEGACCGSSVAVIMDALCLQMWSWQ